MHIRLLLPPGRALLLALALLACLNLVLASGCGKRVIYPPRTTPAPQPSTSPKVKTGKPYTVLGKTYYPLASSEGYVEEGTASWYGIDFHGKPTATGEIYDMYGMTAAHKLLPLNTMVRVTNLGNGRQLELRVNDRGPFVNNRIIDLSYGAADRLGISGPGLGHVRVESISPVPGYHAGNLPGTFYVQVGAFTTQGNAAALQSQLKARGYGGTRVQQGTVRGTTFWRVQVGTYPDLVSAQRAKGVLEREFTSSFVIAD